MCTYLFFLKRFRELLDLAETAEAISLARWMVAENPQSIPLREHLALALWHDGRFSDVSEFFQESELLGRLSPYAQLILVHSLTMQGCRKAALVRLKQFLTLRELDHKGFEQIARKFGELAEYRLASRSDISNCSRSGR